MEVKISMHQKKLEFAHQTGGALLAEDFPVKLTIYDIPVSLFKEFCLKVVQPRYPGGISDAIEDLMRKAILEKEHASTCQTGKNVGCREPSWLGSVAESRGSAT